MIPWPLAYWKHSVTQGSLTTRQPDRRSSPEDVLDFPAGIPQPSKVRPKWGPESSYQETVPAQPTWNQARARNEMKLSFRQTYTQNGNRNTKVTTGADLSTSLQKRWMKQVQTATPLCCQGGPGSHSGSQHQAEVSYDRSSVQLERQASKSWRRYHCQLLC